MIIEKEVLAYLEYVFQISFDGSVDLTTDPQQLEDFVLRNLENGTIIINKISEGIPIFTLEVQTGPSWTNVKVRKDFIRIPKD